MVTVPLAILFVITLDLLDPIRPPIFKYWPAPVTGPEEEQSEMVLASISPDNPPILFFPMTVQEEKQSPIVAP